MRSRVAFLVALLCAASCARPIGPPSMPAAPKADSIESPATAPDSIRVEHIAVDSATHAFLADYRLRRFNHRTEPDAEMALCLYGVVRQDSAIVMFVRPADVVEATGAWVRFHPCPSLNRERFGELRLLGMQHAHMGGVDCGWSAPDVHSFRADPRMLIDLISCSQGLLGRTRGAMR